MRRALLACLLILLPAHVFAQASTGRVLTLDVAVREALEGNRGLATAALDVNGAMDDVKTAKTRRLPTFSVNTLAGALLTPIEFVFPAGSFGTYPATGPIPGEDSVVKSDSSVATWVTASVTQPLTQLFKANLAVSASGVAERIRREQLRAARLEVISSVRTTYFELLKTLAALRASDAAIAAYREVDRTLADHVAEQTALKSERLDVQVKLAQEELTRVKHAHAAEALQERLNQLRGKDVRERFETVPPGESRESALDVSAAVTAALARRPDVRQARLAVEQAELDHRIARAERLPDVSLSFSYLSPYNADPLPTTIATVGLQLQWEPFDWGRAGRERAGKVRRIEQARHQLRDAEDRAALEIAAAFRRLDEARVSTKVAALAGEAARELVRVRTNQFAAKAALLGDVLDAQARASAADSRHQQALAELWDAMNGLDTALGEDEPR